MYFPITIFITLSIPIAALRKEFSLVVPEEYNEQVSCETLSDLTDVQIEIFQLKLVDISTKAMDILAEITYAVSWPDKRLKHEHIESDMVIVPKETAKKLWYPRIHFPDCKGCGKVLVNPNEDEFLYITNVSVLSVTLRQSQRFICHFELAKYPFDTQSCQLKFQTIVQNKDNITLTARKNLIVPLREITQLQPEFKLIDITTVDSKSPHDKINIVCLDYNMRIRRVSTRYFFMIFIPSLLIVIISWVAFWLEPDATGPRISIGLTLLLTLFMHFNNAQRDLPVVATMTAVDIGMFFCLFSVFGCLLEVAITYYYYFKIDSKTVTPIMIIPVNQNQSAQDNQKVIPMSKDSKEIAKVFTAKKIDVASRVIFPLTFILFNIFFWFYYCL